MDTSKKLVLWLSLVGWLISVDDNVIILPFPPATQRIIKMTKFPANKKSRFLLLNFSRTIEFAMPERNLIRQIIQNWYKGLAKQKKPVDRLLAASKMK